MAGKSCKLLLFPVDRLHFRNWIFIWIEIPYTIHTIERMKGSGELKIEEVPFCTVDWREIEATGAKLFIVD